MTYDQFQTILDEIRRRQGTDRPLVQVVMGAYVVRGRVVGRSSGRHNPNSPYGVLVLEQPGLTRGPCSFVQIASIPDGGLLGDGPQDSRPPAQEVLVDFQAVGELGEGRLERRIH
jgi:hypothetical protein